MPTKLRLDAAPATLVSLAVILALAVTGIALSGGRALASHVSCGDTITTDTTLDSDLVNCPNNGIVIGADGITLDLNGHLIDGDGSTAVDCDPNAEVCDTGVVDDGHDGVTVRNGRVRQFGVGVLFGISGPGLVRHNRVLRLRSSRNEFFGIVLASSARSVVRNNSFDRNPGPDGDGMGLFVSHHVRVVHNSFRHNALGLHVADSTRNLIKGNFFSGHGMLLEEANRNQVRRNRCARSGFACILVGRGNRNVIARNRSVRGVVGIGIEKGRGNLIVGNIVLRPRGTGIYLGLRQPPLGPVNNIVRRNLVRGSGGDGFVVRPKATHVLLRSNIARRNADDGFDIQARTTKLTGNRANRNADLGIKGVRGVIDGGGNVARYNGDPRQCTNIVCT